MSNDREGPDVSRGTMEPAAAVFGRVLGGEWEEVACPACGQPFARRKGADFTQCADCVRAGEEEERVRREAHELTRGTGNHIARWLQEAGMSKRELTATLDGIAPTLKRRLWGAAELSVSTLLAGGLPARGFGLSGGAGRGKTFALAAIFKQMALARWESRAPREGFGVLRRWLGWVAWPEMVNKLRLTSLGENGHAEAAEHVAGMSEIEALVIDDLGAERMRGGYEEDWATAQLDLIIDTRYNEMKPTWYTTNLPPEGFAERYGARIFSRLCAENTMVVVPQGPDLRMVP